MIQTLSVLAAGGGHGGGFGLHQMLIVGSTAIVVSVLILLALAARKQIGVVPRGLGAAFEHVFDWIEGMATDMIGAGCRQYVPLLMSFFLFILFSNWSGLLPLPVMNYGAPHHHAAAGKNPEAQLEAEVKEEVQEETQADHAQEHVMFEAPTASYNTTLALAMISFFAFNWFGIKKNVFPNWGKSEHGAHHEHAHEGDDHHHHSAGGLVGVWNWILHYIQPTPMLYRSFDGGLKLLAFPLGVLFLCLNIMEEFARILSLSLRLFGNISGEHQVKVILADVMRTFLMQSLAGFKAGSLIAGPAWLGVSGLIFGAALFATLLGALAGFVQAMVFTMLSLVYIAHAVADEH